MASEKKVDPEALQAYRTIVQAQLEIVENTIVPKLRNGEELGKLPAFGMLDSSEAARTSYTTFHETTWNNLQAIRESLHGIIKTLNDSGDLHQESDEASAGDFSSDLE